MSNLTENETYWSETWCEILHQNGIDICVDNEKHESIAKDFASNAEVQGNYMAPVEGDSEMEKLKLKIKKLESRIPCTYCGGHGGKRISYGTRSGWSECIKCNGKAWIQR